MGADSYLRRIEQYQSQKSLSEEDAETIKKFISYKKATQTISSERLLKITGILCSWRTKFLDHNFTEITNEEWIASAGFIRTSNLKQNTIRDYLIISRNFLEWLQESGGNKNLTHERIKKVKLIPAQRVTKTPDMLVNDADVQSMLDHPNCKPMTAALISILYYTGMRPGEALGLQWKDLEFTDQLLKIRITDSKNGGKTRYAPTSEAIDYVAYWRDHYPKEIPGGPTRDNYVFVSKVNYQSKPENPYASLNYYTAKNQVSSLSKAAIGRKINLYIFRASDITNSSAKGVPDSVNKAIHWGNQSTEMLTTYLLLKDVQIDKAILNRAGIYENEAGKKTKNILCNHCFTQNTGESDYCKACGRPLTKAAIQKHQEEMERKRQQLEKESTEEMIRIVAKAYGMSSEEFTERILKNIGKR